MKTAAILLILSAATAFAQQDLNVNYKLRAGIYAASSVEDHEAAGGFGGSENYARPINGKFSGSDIFLKIDAENSIVLLEKYNGYKLYLVNGSNSTVGFSASDSRLPVVAQAFVDNKWQDIEYLPSSWCGNSYHTVSLKPGEYWEFEVPKFAGKIKTKVRYKLSAGIGKELYSNAVPAGINREQLYEKQGHTPNGLMDPYND